ncbi:DUF262 domain-containing protein [Methylocapsa sp. D3K7]|uniref:DUF262 domain-containing protein n=1 Tax=Methylocapsa sp. D3K7 TaxID=3041435 RepID=UPI00244F0124|nr:DUF262 domain-containing protein [Methylocapsa sp. D3K7]WGJ16371.1 DUF262 domain-containing protein [Methylocapsa sp. D3K7]
MDVHKSSLLAVFDAKQRLEVPLFQRQYVWNEEQQWLPLWEDIERKFTETLEGRKDAPKHFLGAMVLDQKQTPTGHVVVRQVIDGQQRLTTLQVFLSAYRDFCKAQGCDALAAECDKFLFNTGMMADPNVDKFKVWPTQLDRPQFTDVVSAGSREEVLKRNPLRKKPYARKPDPRPRMVEAYLFFFDQLKGFFLGDDGESPLAANYPISARVDECFQTLRNALMVVVIDLQKDDDPQVIFETLNARGEPLLPADLLRNYIFFRANRENLDIEAVYKKYWSRFDEEFWREEVKQGRLNRPRSDLFMQHFLSSRQGQDIPIKHLYVEYRHWLETTNPFQNLTEELATLARQGDHFRRIIAPVQGDIVFELCSFLDAYDIRTAYPLLLALMDVDLDDAEWTEISHILESYLLRRAVCNLGTKNYNRIFLSLTRSLRKDGYNAASLKQLLLAQTGESGVWPDNAAFREAWLHKPLYGPLNSPKLVYLYARLNQTYLSSKCEALTFSKQPTVEHIMPQDWIENWPLQDGSKGMDFMELYRATENDPHAAATRKRERALQTLGNLTILSTGLNAAQSNYGWDQKRREMKKHSLLPINQNLLEMPVWDETTILERGEELFERALHIWCR